MKLKTAILFALPVVSLLILSCIVTSHDYSAEISCDEFSEDSHRSGEFEVEVGDKIRLELCSNPTTGFTWDYEITVADVLKEEDHDFEEPEEDILGAAGTEFWTFEAVEEGTTEVRMEYSQQWEGGIKAEWTYTLNVTVK